VKVWRAHEAPVPAPAAGAGAPAAPAAGEIDREAAMGTAAGVLVLDEVQPEGKRVMAAREWRAGARGAVHVDPA
jgi:hypothetical protein